MSTQRPTPTPASPRHAGPDTPWIDRWPLARAPRPVKTVGTVVSSPLGDPPALAGCRAGGATLGILMDAALDVDWAAHRRDLVRTREAQTGPPGTDDWWA